MSDNRIEAEWTEALKRAKAERDDDVRYRICERFLDRAVTRIVGRDADCSRLVAMWYDRNRSDRECADKAQLMMPACDDVERPVLKIISELDAKDLYIDPESVGVACAESAYIAVRHSMSVYITCVRDMMGVTYRSGMVGADDRAAEIAHNNEKRLQILDVQEELAFRACVMDEEAE